MKFSCERDLLMREIQTAQEIISSRNALSILSNVLLQAEGEQLAIRATDLKVGFETGLPVEVSAPGIVTVYCEKLLSILRALPEGEVEFAVEDSSSFVIRPRFKKIDFRLKSISADKFPAISRPADEPFFPVEQKTLDHMISQTIFAISDDETRYFMNGVYLEKDAEDLVMVATDGRRLSHVRARPTAPIPDFAGVIIPPKILNLVRKLLSGEGTVQMAIADKQIFLDFDQHQLASALIDGDFPNYRRVIPEEQEHRITISRDDLLAALRRVALLVEKSRRVYIDLSTDQLTLRSEETDLGVARESIPCEYAGPEIVMALNYQYLLDPLRVIGTETVSIEFSDPTKATTLRSVPESDYFHIIMPMQLD